MNTKLLIIMLTALAAAGCQRSPAAKPSQPSMTQFERQNEIWDLYRDLDLRGPGAHASGANSIPHHSHASGGSHTEPHGSQP